MTTIEPPPAAPHPDDDWFRGPCANGEHSSHDNHQGIPDDGDAFWLDIFDCKNQRDSRTQCMCRATWPRTRVQPPLAKQERFGGTTP